MQNVLFVHVLNGYSDLSDDPSNLFFSEGSIFFEFGGQIVVESGLVEGVEEILIAEEVVELDDVGVIE